MRKYIKNVRNLAIIHLKVKQIKIELMPELVSKKLYYKVFKKELNLKCPKTFNEKLQWLKLNKFDDLVVTCADKYKMRDYVKDRGQSEILCKLYGVYDRAEEIDFSKLPNKFVLKCTHGCGFNIICTDKEKVDIDITKSVLNNWLKEKFGYKRVELHYNKIQPRIICEEYLEDYTHENLIDYKIYCFNGKAHYTLVCFDRGGFIKKAFYDIDWNKKDFRKDNTEIDVEQPVCYKEMLRCAEALSEPFTFVRLDFYNINDKPILGELTFTPGACLSTEYTEEAEISLGDLINLSK